MITTAAASLLLGSSVALLSQPEPNYIITSDPVEVVMPTVETLPPTTTTTAKPVDKTPVQNTQKAAPTSANTVTTSVPQVVQEGEWRLPDDCTAGGKKSREHSLHCWGGLIARYDWPQAKAFAVMHCESQGDANARNPRSSATGLMQILRGTTDPVANMRQAYGMWQARGWQPWVCA